MQLFKEFSLITIIEMVVLLCIAVKGTLTFWEWAEPRIRKAILKSDQPEKIQKSFQQHLQDFNMLKNDIDNLAKKIDMLIQSDKDAIKAYITQEHHYFVYRKEWIDDYSLDCIERRYDLYKEEGGNSFIKGLMQEIRELPKKPIEQN